MRDSRFSYVDLEGSVFRDTSLGRVTMRGVELWDADISGDLRNVVINGVDVAPLIEAELDRRDPDRVKMRPSDPAGFREACDIVERLWSSTVDRARALPPAQLHESVADEWSFIETLRHMVFVTDCWVRRAILGDPSPWDALSLPWDGMPDTPGVPRDRNARPSLDEVLALRHGRMATVRQVVDSLTDESLAADTTPVEGPGWPPAKAFPVRRCLSIVLNEEWNHRLFAERDLAVLFAR
ncbi:DinB family protein [Actinoplanes bogorensis]|uniref:DinB family protein n=2 Tax=Paractinoplanes bogorensis TaxID=1610840 RepID=A0ABS5YVA6_9ACTN|nr:DinB family protein [Actinoplanes bogorensis]